MIAFINSVIEWLGVLGIIGVLGLAVIIGILISPWVFAKYLRGRRK